LDPSFFWSRLGGLARAVYEGSKPKVEENVREVFSCDVTLYEDPRSLEISKILSLPRIRIDARVLKGKLNKLVDSGVKIYAITENPVLDDYEEKYILSEVENPDDIIPFETYILSGAYYSPDAGLLFEKHDNNAISSFEPVETKIDGLDKSKEIKEMRKETWVEHAKKTLYVLDHYLLPRYYYTIKKFAEYFGYTFDEFIGYIRCIASLHDLGKLNEKWQKKVGWDGKTPLAHSDNREVKKLPPHATVSAKALQPYLEEIFGDEDESVFKAFYLAIAHHHAPWSKEYQEYKLIPNFYYFVKEVWNIPGEKIADKNTSGRLDFAYLDLTNENEGYRLYGLLSKLIRISDRLATGGVSYESLFST